MTVGPVCQADLSLSLSLSLDCLFPSVGLSRSQCVGHQSKFSLKFFFFLSSLCNISCFLSCPAFTLPAAAAAPPTFMLIPQLQSSLVFSQLASFSFECDYPKAVGWLRCALIDGRRRRAMSLAPPRLSCPLPTMSLSSSYRRRRRTAAAAATAASASAAAAGSLFAVLLTLARVWLKSSHTPHASRTHTHTPT